MGWMCGGIYNYCNTNQIIMNKVTYTGSDIREDEK